MAKINAKESYNQYLSILSDLKAKKVKPFYLLMGEEPYYIDKICHYIMDHILSPEEQGFNQSVLYGTESTVTVQQIIETARRYPMMAPRQVVVVREAQLVRDLKKLEIYLRQPPDTTVLVICYSGESIEKSSLFYKAAIAKGAVLESVPLREFEVADWITRYATEMKVVISPEAAVLLADYLGTDLGKICMEMDKLLILLPVDSKRIDVQAIEQNVGISREYSPFALCKAISYRDLPTALKIVRYFGNHAKNYPLVKILNALCIHFERILKYHALQEDMVKYSRQEMASKLGLSSIYFLNEMETAARNFPLKKTAYAIWLMRACDSRFKSNEKGEADEGDLLQELIFKIMR